MKEKLKMVFDFLVAVSIMNVCCFIFVFFVVGVLVAPLALVVYTVNCFMSASVVPIVNVILLALLIYYVYTYISKNKEFLVESLRNRLLRLF